MGRLYCDPAITAFDRARDALCRAMTWAELIDEAFKQLDPSTERERLAEKLDAQRFAQEVG